MRSWNNQKAVHHEGSFARIETMWRLCNTNSGKMYLPDTGTACPAVKTGRSNRRNFSLAPCSLKKGAGKRWKMRSNRRKAKHHLNHRNTYARPEQFAANCSNRSFAALWLSHGSKLAATTRQEYQ